MSRTYPSQNSLSHGIPVELILIVTLLNLGIMAIVVS
jgi:hypothetical protein